jgi:NADH-dependent peroxiredoxin subunit F
MYDIIIIGGGVGALSAGIYAGRKKMKVAIIADEIGGQSALQPEFNNYPGYLEVDGYKLVQNMKRQVEGLEVDMFDSWRVERIGIRKEGQCEIFQVFNARGEIKEARSLLIATGGKPKFLGIPGEAEYYAKGVTYCATCDAPLFGGKRTAVVGGGNTGTESALLLARYAAKVYLLHRRDELRADEVTKEKLANEKDKIEILYSAKIAEILGSNGWVRGLNYTDKSGEKHELAVDGVFVAIGFVANSDIAKEIVSTNQFGEIVVDPKTNMTSHPGIFAAGDVTDIPYKQAIIATGEAAKAVLAAYQWLLSCR